MSFKHILVPYDKSETALKALRQGIEIAKSEDDAQLDVIYVTAVPDVSMPAKYSTSLYEPNLDFVAVDGIVSQRNEIIETERAGIMELIGPEFECLGDRVSITIVPGLSPADDIIDFVKDHDCDLIVMGCRGLGAIRSMLGSVSSGVLRSSEVPVLIVK